MKHLLTKLLVVSFLVALSLQLIAEEIKLPLQNQEKIILSFDRTNYVPGDIIWFSGYILATEDHSLKGNEYFAHICLYAPNGKLISHEVFAIKKGTIKGQIAIPKLSNKGVYRVVAYTNWMRNWPRESLFEKQIWVNGEKASQKIKIDYEWQKTENSTNDSLIVSVNTDTKNRENNLFLNISTELITSKRKPTTESKLSSSEKTIIKLPVDKDDKQDSLSLTVEVINGNITSKQEILVLQNRQKPDVQFLPESGQLIPGIKQTVAFKSIGSDGLPVEIKGELYDTDNNQIAQIATKYSGMGKISFTPVLGKTYFAKVTDAANKSYRYDLPTVQEKGAILQATQQLSDVDINIYAAKLTAPLKLAVHCRGSIILEKEYTTLPVEHDKISMVNFPKGIIHFTVLNSENMPLCERLVFNHPKKTIKVDFPGLRQSYIKRDSVALDVQVNNLPDGQLALYNVSVCDKNFIHPYLKDNTVSQLYLSSELPGFITNPTYYLNQTEASNMALNLLLLTNGYCRFNWNELATSTEDVPNEYEANIYLKGNIRHILTNKPLKENFVSGNFYGKGNNIKKTATTDDDGKFKFEFPDINYDLSTNLYFAGKNGVAKDVRGTIETLLDVTEIDFAKSNTIVSKTDKGPILPYLSLESIALDNIALKDIPQNIDIKEREDNFFETGLDTITLPEVQVSKNRYLNEREKLRNTLGTPIKIITDKQVMAMANDVYWYSSLKHLIYYLYPELDVMGRKKQIYYVLNNRRIDTGDEFDNILFQSIDPKQVTSIELYKTSKNYEQYMLPEEEAITDPEVLMKLPPYIISITTIGGSGSWGNAGKQTFNGKVYGYTAAKMPYAPKYSISGGDSILYDARKTLFWNPLVIAKNSVTKPFSFYTGDIEGDKLVVIEGFTTNGTPFYGETTLTISQTNNTPKQTSVKSIRDISKRTISKFEKATNKVRNTTKILVKCIDAKTRSVVAFAPLSTNTGDNLVSNADGEFYIDKTTISELKFLKSGYNNKTISTATLKSDSVLIAINPLSIKVVGTSLNARSLVEEAIKFTNNQMNKKADLSTFFREKVYQNDAIVSLEEWYLNSNIYSYGVNNIESTINFVKGKAYKTFDFKEVIRILPNQRDNNFTFTADPMNARKQFLDLVYMKYYNYNIEGETTVNGTPCYIILFDVKPNEYVPGYQGKLLIGKDQNYIHEVAYSISSTNLEYLDESVYVNDNPGIGDLILENSSYLATYNCEADNYYPIFLHEKIKFSINNRSFQTFEREAITSKSHTEIEIEDRLQNETKKHTYLVKNPLYDKAFFEDVISIKLPKKDEVEIPFLHEISRFR